MTELEPRRNKITNGERALALLAILTAMGPFACQETINLVKGFGGCDSAILPGGEKESYVVPFDSTGKLLDNTVGAELVGKGIVEKAGIVSRNCNIAIRRNGQITMHTEKIQVGEPLGPNAQFYWDEEHGSELTIIHSSVSFWDGKLRVYIP